MNAGLLLMIFIVQWSEMRWFDWIQSQETNKSPSIHIQGDSFNFFYLFSHIGFVIRHHIRMRCDITGIISTIWVEKKSFMFDKYNDNRKYKVFNFKEIGTAFDVIYNFTSNYE